MKRENNMNKKEIILCVVFGGLLLKIIKNQEVIDDHINDISKNGHGGVWSDSVLSNNTIRAKLYRKYYARKNKNESE